MKKQTLILNKIREVCPELMELSMGCELEWQRPKKGFKRTFWHYSEKHGEELRKYAVILSHYVDGLGDEHWGRLTVKTADLKPLGHEPHLEHLLRAIQGYEEKMSLYLWPDALEFESNVGNLYNLTKTLSQNLDENEALCDFLIGVLNLEV